MMRMFSLSLLAWLVALTLGCNGSQSQNGSNSSVAATDLTRRMVGKWASDGNVALIIELDGDRVVVSAPENDTWRIDMLDAKIVDDAIHFVQKNYLRNGDAHPFNGVACNSVVRIVGDDVLELRVTTVHSPDYESELLARIK